MLNWLESRTGFVSMAKEFLTEDVPGGASYWYVFGSATLFAMIVQITTGIFLTFFYAPSAATAWESTRAIYLNPWTHTLLSIHYWGSSAMIALVFLHLLQVLIFGAYKSPRELQWIVGVLLLLVTLVLGLTGYLLPWDMDAYFASQVSLNIAGLPPGGEILQLIAQGGPVMGTNTINRFFGLHVWLMPAVLVLLVAAHLDDLPPQRIRRPGGRRSAQTQTRTFLAGSNVHGRRRVVLSCSSSSCCWRASRRRSSTKKPIPRTQRSCPIRRGIFLSLWSC